MFKLTEDRIGLPLKAPSPIDFNLLLNLIEIKSQPANASLPIVSSVSGNSSMNCLPLNAPLKAAPEIPFILRLGSNFTLIIFPEVFLNVRSITSRFRYIILAPFILRQELSRVMVASSLTSAFATTE